ncbi:MAG: DegT/DnrJ/EryC1/StrS family aminotransferase [Bryobacteraceae bacterium]
MTTGAMGLNAAVNERPALLGGKPVRSQPFPAWPKFDQTEERALTAVLRSGKWFRGSGAEVQRFEDQYASMMNAKHCLATANGTSALIVSMQALGVGPGKEVILPPYTFVACVNAILMLHAVPVFVDTDPETFQMDARKLEAAISDRTAAIMPVHMGGNTADLDSILAIAAKRKLPVIEDACQAHLAEWRDRKAGTLGTTGCFSFQASKNLNSGEGGAILTGDESLLERCYSFHNNSRGKKVDSYNFSYQGRGANFRMTEFQAALLLGQMSRLQEQARTREQNGKYLSELLRGVAGIQPAREYDGCRRNAYHLYMMRYRKEHFAGLPRAVFLKALRAEGIPASAGYVPLNKEPFIKSALATPVYQVMYKDRVAGWEERNQCPENDRVCEEAVWLTQNVLLASRSEMEQIATAIRKIHSHAAQLARM